MKLLALSTAFAAGCSFQAPPGGLVDASPPVDDMEVDVPPGACIPWPSLNVEDPCSSLLGTPENLTLTSSIIYQLDTTTGMFSGGMLPPHVLAGAVVTQVAGPSLRVVNLSDFMIAQGATLAVTGTLGLVLVVHGAADISGEIQASARLVGSPGASVPGPGGSDAVICTDGAKVGTGEDGGASTNLMSGGGGGGGGAFGETGGSGSDGNSGGHGAHGTGGVKAGTADLVPLRAGCAGGTGGDDGDATSVDGGRRGDGGGAVEITAGGVITVLGSVSAGGLGGGGAGPQRAGGGGGGSGGAILLDGARVTITGSAQLCSNGGGGGEGGQVGFVGATGENATCSEKLAAVGGRSIAQGGDGGNGGFIVAMRGSDATSASAGAGGGGGGGSGGRIHIRSRDGAANIDQAATLSPNPL